VSRRPSHSGTGRPQQQSPAEAAGRSSDFPLRITIIVVALALVAGFALRATDLRADPPPDLSWSSAIYSDEAHNAYSARNWALYGRWQVDDYAPYVVYPWLNLFTGLVFRIAGVGFVQLKLASVLAGLLLIPTMYFLGRSVTRRAGVVAAVAAAFSYPLVMYSRLGLAELSQVLLVAATIAFLARAGSSRAAAVLSGACALFAVLFVKVSALFVPFAALLVLSYELARAHSPGQRKALAGQALFWLLGAAVPLAAWLAVIFIPHRETYLAYVVHHSFGAKAGHPAGIVAYLLNGFSVGSNSRLFARLPLVAFTGFAALPAFFGRARRTAVFSALILVAGVAMLGYGYYHPPRYELFSLIPLITGFALAADRLLEKDVRIGHPWPRLPGVLLYGLWLWPLAVQVAFRRPDAGALVAALLVSQAASLGLWALHRTTDGGIRLRGKALRFGLAAVLVGLALGRGITQYAGWFGTRTNVVSDYSRDLDSALPDSAVTGGFWAPAMLASSHKRALFISDQWGVNLADPIGRFGLTHLVVTDQNEFRLLDSITGGRASQATILRRYQVRDRSVVVLELRH